MERVRVGFVGIHFRGTGMLKLLCGMEDVDVVAVCDEVPENCETGFQIVKELQNGREPRKYLNFDEMIASDDINAVMICTSWVSHAPLAIKAMKAGKYAAFEVGGACSLEECWKLVRTYETTKVPCMLMENCCYGRTELAILNMIKMGMFGELCHMQGAYGHDLSDSLISRIEENHYRHHHYYHRNCENYPTHELGPICSMLNINRGNRLLSLTSTASKARGLNTSAADILGPESEPAHLHWENGDVITTVIKCTHGETITINLDTTLPRPYSRELCVQGTKGIFMEDGNHIYLENVSPEKHVWEDFTPYLEKYDHPLWKWFMSEGVKGGHGGMDYLIQRGFIESVKNQTQTPIDAYDSATLMSITTLSEDSIASGSKPVAIPDFTNGRWIDRGEDPKSRYSLDSIHRDLF